MRYVMHGGDEFMTLVQSVRYHLEEMFDVGYYDSRLDRDMLLSNIKPIIELLIRTMMQDPLTPSQEDWVAGGIYAHFQYQGANVKMFDISLMVYELLECSDYAAIKRKIRNVQSKSHIFLYDPDAIEINLNESLITFIYRGV